MEYLTAKGVNTQSMKWKSYSETKLVNRCKNNVECTEEKKQKNRI